MASTVPYTPYRSKRHSKSPSVPFVEHPSPSPPLLAPVPVPASSPAPAPLFSKAAQKAPEVPSKEQDSTHEIPLPPLPPSTPPQSLVNGYSSASTSATSSPASSTRTLSPPATPTLSTAPTLTPRSSTFRRIPPRTSSTAPLAPSPLGSGHARQLSTDTVSSVVTRHSTVRKVESHPNGGTNGMLTLPTNRPAMSSPLARPVNGIAAPTPVHATETPSQPHISAGPSRASSTSTPQSLSPTPSPSPRRPAAPYRPGFQPKGMYRHRTDEFIAVRSASRDRDKIEQRRLERRLEKLIQLHFTKSTSPDIEKSNLRRQSTSRRQSSIFELDLRRNPTDIWRDVIEPRIQGPKAAIRAEEQNITPWQDDAAVSQCPLCSTSFHPLTNRKHHCRLCGRIICSLPIRPPTRAQTCSILFVVDQKTGRIEEVGEGVDYGVKKKPPNGKTKADDEEKFLKGVRICRDCRTVLLRQQYLQDANCTPTSVQLHEALVQLEKEIEDALPQFHELILSLSTDTSLSPQHATSTEMRKRLLTSFGEYDRLAKRIRQLPCVKGSSQDRVQNAILTRATLFLQKNMFPLQTLPKPQKNSLAAQNLFKTVDKDSELALKLQPLLEQEALIESFVDEANAQRKFEDARTLKANLEEIRAEIQRMVVEADRGG